MTKLTLDQFFDIQSELMDEIKNQEAKLMMIRGLDQPIAIKWQAFIGIILPLQILTIAKHGFSADQKGLSNFNDQLMKLNQEHELLHSLNQKKWEYLLEKAFGINQVEKVSLAEARALINEISEEMMAEEFLQVVDQIALLFAGEETLTQRRQKLLEVIFPLHMRVMEKHGFEGDDGYIKAQRAIMEHYYDPQIMEMAAKAQNVVFKRAKLKD